MDYGLFILSPMRDRAKPIATLIAEIEAQAKLAENLGFSTVWFAEHHLSNVSVCPSPLMLAVHCAARTRRIRVGTAILVLPFYQPIRLIEEMAYADILTGGRLTVGVGSGNQDHEARRFGTRGEDLPERFTEMLDILDIAFGDGPIAYEGRHFKIPETEIVVRPRRNPAAPVHIGGMAHVPAVVDRVARKGYVPFLSPQWKPVEAFVETRDTLAAAHVAAGHAPGSMPLAVQRYVHVAADRSETRVALEQLRYGQRVAGGLKARSARFDGAWVSEPEAGTGEPTDAEILERLVFGDAETCAERIVEDHRLLGHSHMSCFVQFGGMEGRHALDVLERFGRDVIPAVDKALAAAAPKKAAIA
ncbi:MAG: LLM class flavin-dependent oxidoreductase [Alphaproteobacteria bacterium]